MHVPEVIEELRAGQHHVGVDGVLFDDVFSELLAHEFRERRMQR